MTALRIIPVFLLFACGSEGAGPQSPEVTVNTEVTVHTPSQGAPEDAGSAPAPASSDESIATEGGWALQPGATVGWEGFKPGSSHVGGFGTISGNAEVDGQTLKSLVIEIDMSSVNSDKDKLTKHLKEPDFFNVAKHPKARFTLTSVDSDTSISGDLEIMGQSKNITAPVSLTWGEGTLGVQGSFSIDRTHWGIVYKSAVLGTVADKIIDDKVDLSVDLSFAAP